MLAHGLVSSSLFLAITFLYDRYCNRLIKYYHGMVITMPLFGMYFFLLVLVNASYLEVGVLSGSEYLYGRLLS